MQQTANYGFLKPEDNEAFDEQAHANTNMDAIDTQIKTRADDHAAHLADNVPHIPYAIASGATNVYIVTLNPVPASYTEGMAIAIKISIENTGASTVNVNGLGVKSIKKPNGNDVSAGNLKAGSIYTLRYNGTNFILQGEGGGGTATTGDVLAGKTFTNDSGEQAGAMPNRGAVVLTPGTTNQAITAGYHNGSGYVLGDADLISANIKAGVNIFGVAGNSNVINTSPGTAVAGDILAGKIAFVDGAQLTGTMINRGALAITPGTAQQAIVTGYHDGNGYVQGDSDLTAANIKKDVLIFGITGTFQGRIATGSLTITDSNYTQQRTISGLGFQPTWVHLEQTGFSTSRFIATKGSILGVSLITMNWMRNDGGSTEVSAQIAFTSDGFTFYPRDPYDSTETIYWWAGKFD
ncbi:phage tail protein [Pelotomaculum propionicicum]|uniref:phage tail protein n=1 Tax=Pelotomaculum propionicicum TaxID=258475 RepID=UPI003B7DB16B